MSLHKVLFGLTVLGLAGFTAALPLQDELQVRQTGCTSATAMEAAKSSDGFNSTTSLDLEKREEDTFWPGYCSAGTAQWCYFCYYGRVEQVKCSIYNRCTATSNECNYSDMTGIAVCS